MTEGSEEQLGFGKLRKAEDLALLAEDFEPAGGDLWRRDGTYFAREAALQNVHIVYSRAAVTRPTTEACKAREQSSAQPPSGS